MQLMAWILKIPFSGLSSDEASSELGRQCKSWAFKSYWKRVTDITMLIVHEEMEIKDGAEIELRFRS